MIAEHAQLDGEHLNARASSSCLSLLLLYVCTAAALPLSSGLAPKKSQTDDFGGFLATSSSMFGLLCSK